MREADFRRRQRESQMSDAAYYNALDRRSIRAERQRARRAAARSAARTSGS